MLIREIWEKITVGPKLVSETNYMPAPFQMGKREKGKQEETVCSDFSLRC